MCVAFVISHVSITLPLPPLPLFHTCWYVSVDALVVVKMPYAPPVPWIRPQSAGGFPSVEFGPVPGTAPLLQRQQQQQQESKLKQSDHGVMLTTPLRNPSYRTHRQRTFASGRTFAASSAKRAIDRRSSKVRKGFVPFSDVDSALRIVVVLLDGLASQHRPRHSVQMRMARVVHVLHTHGGTTTGSYLSIANEGQNRLACTP